MELRDVLLGTAFRLFHCRQEAEQWRLSMNHAKGPLGGAGGPRIAEVPTPEVPRVPQ